MIASAQALMVAGKGLLAIDESVDTCNRRLAEAGIAPTDESRCRYRELLVTASGLAESISGAILFEETLQQRTRDGLPLVEVLRAAGIRVGVKVDRGAKAMAGHAGERVTEGLDGLRERLQHHAAQGACFAKWRAVLAITDELPTRACIEANAHALARYAALCQEVQIVPIVEPEVLMAGGHSLARCGAVTTEVLHQVFEHLHRQGVVLQAMILKPNMVLPGQACTTPATWDEVAEATLNGLLSTVPAAVAGVAFLSRGAGRGVGHRPSECHASASGPLRAGGGVGSVGSDWLAVAAHVFLWARVAGAGAEAVGGQGRKPRCRAERAAAPRAVQCRRDARGLAPRHGGRMTTGVTLCLVRHGETAWSRSGQHTGLTELELTAEGEEQARSLTSRLKGLAPTRVLVSPRRRAQQTCEAAGLGAASETEPDLAEWDYGRYEGLRSTDIRADSPGWNIWRDGCPGGESPADVRARADRLIARLVTLRGTVVLFSHGQFGAAFAARWIGLALVEGQHFALHTASVSLLGTDPNHPARRVIESWNERPMPPSRSTSTA
jgi:fructose-bisphosphate aldolase, class I